MFWSAAVLCRFPDRARHFARPDLCARGGQEDCALYQKRPTPQGGSTSPKAMPTAVGAIIDYRRLSSLLSTRPQIAFHRFRKKRPRDSRGRSHFLFGNNLATALS